jgi:hypothetical protein
MKIMKRILMIGGVLLATTHSQHSFASAESDLRKLWKETARAASDKDHMKRAALLESLEFYHLAMEDYIWAGIKNPIEGRALARSGELALILERSADLDRLVMVLRRNNLPTSSWPAALRMAVALGESRAGNEAAAKILLPSRADLASIKDREARDLAYLHAASIAWRSDDLNSANSFLQAGVDQKSRIDGGIFRLQKARLYFESRKYQDAMIELAKLSRTSTSWYGGVLVGAWSAYLMGDYNLTLGQLMTLQSPFLVRKFLPESYILQAATLYQLCHYQSAKRSLEALKSQYAKLPGAIDRFSRQYRSSQQKIAAVIGHVRGRSVNLSGFDTILVDRLMDGIYQDDTLPRLDRSLIQIASESKRFERLFPEAQSPAFKVLRGRYTKNLRDGRNEIYRLFGRSIYRRLEQMKVDVADAFENLLPIQVEINTQIRDRLVKSKVPVGVDVEFDAEIKDGFEFWPFEGEYWRDEVGSYAFATTGVCREQGL